MQRKMAAATTGGLFGSSSAGFSFGSGATSTGFGTPTLGTNTLGSNTLGASGFSAIKPFGASTATSTLSTPFGQQTATTAGATTGFKFGGLGSTTASTFSGFNTAKTTSTVPTLGTFGQTNQLGQSSGFALGVTPGASTSTGLNLASGLFKPSTAATTTTTLLGSTPAAPTGLALGTSSLIGSGLGAFSGFNAIKTTAAASTTTSATLSGLGGTGTSTSGGATGAVGGVASKQGDVKDTALPNPLNEIAEHIKKYVKEQKEHRDEISRVSGSTLEKVREETIALRQALALVSNSIQRDGCAVENLKIDVSQELKNAEIAQRTNDIPPPLQHENVAPQEYFQRLVESFEERMLMYRKQIEIMESHLASLSQGQTLTPQDLSDVMHKVHETFIALAAQLHEFHEAVKVQKEHYLNYRRAYFKESTDIFSSNSKDLSKSGKCKDTAILLLL
ncbi:nucleoporin p58/p45-like [Orbicella faveolata]|uniref:nucleoporin p58/p45-like n=1 Tax=Orbicella faveolata TaxID=48498 RepID=UPI0009E627D7|nr:nucleoporin p58/p45-like [Orbicella faveolata]